MAGQLDLSGFNTPEQSFGGLYRAADTVQKQRKEDQEMALQKQGRQAATSKFLADYLDPKDHLTGTNYDPQIVGGFNTILQQAQQLASKGASTPDIMMAIGPSVNKLNQYSVTAKQIDQTIKGQLQKLKPYSGYNLEALETEAKKQAFYGADGKLKDLSTVDPNQDYVSMAAKNSPELVTTSKGLDDFIAKTPMNESSMTATTAYGGRTQQNTFDAKFHDWMTPQKDDKGNIATDENGMVLPMTVKGTAMLDDNNKPIVNPQTGKPFIAIDNGYFQKVMQHNPDVADFIRGEVNKSFKSAGAKEIPPEHSPQWDMMARHILADELQNRDHSVLKSRDIQKESAQAIKIDIAQNPDQLDAIARFNAAQRGTGEYAIYNPKAGKAVKTNAVEAIGKVFNNDPLYLSGDHTELTKDGKPIGRNVVDVTDFLPGGGLKSGRGDNDAYKGIYYDPAKRSLLVTKQDRVKGPDGVKAEDLEEIPESKAGIFMTRIAAANGVDPEKVSDILTKLGYKGAKFNNASQPGNIPAALNQEHQNKVETALKDEKYGELKGIQTADGTIQKVNDRYIRSSLPNILGGTDDKFSVDIKGKDGKTTTKYFKDKEALTDYIKGGSTAPAASTPAKGSSGIQWKQ